MERLNLNVEVNKCLIVLHYGRVIKRDVIEPVIDVVRSEFI